ncbi:MAG: RIP metalloprotease RseP [Verrucomicrobia bacterium]|nr:RIP metalloprotease RseP [Verrucomicrobiota bacterium]
MDIFAFAAMLLLVGASIFIHELGHFWLARRRGMVVKVFSIGFGPAIWKKTVDGVEYRISWIPLGGYVLLPQMNPAEMLEGKSDEPAEPLPPVTPLTKIVVALAGPAMNFAFAIVLAMIIWVVGMPSDERPEMLVVTKVPDTSSEYAAGLRAGDKIERVDGYKVANLEDVYEMVVTSTHKEIPFVVDREGKKVRLLIEPKRNAEEGFRIPEFELGNATYIVFLEPGAPAEKVGLKIGDKILSVADVPVLNVSQLRDLLIHSAGKPLPLKFERRGKRMETTITPFFDSKESRGRIGVRLGWDPYAPKVTVYRVPLEQLERHIYKTMRVLGALLHPSQTGITPSKMSGIPGIAQAITRGIKESFMNGLDVTLLVNVNLAILNLLPIPVIDGGHILFALVEWLRRKPLNGRFVRGTWTVFASVLIAFLLYINLNDVWRIVKPHIMPGKTAETNAVQQVAPQPQQK